MSAHRACDPIGRWFTLACVLLACAAPGTRRAPADFEQRVSGRLLRSESYCHTPPTPARPHAGSVRVFAGGRRGYGVPAEPLLIVQADQKAGYVVYLPPGRYCFAGGESALCNVEVTVTRSAPPEPVDVYYQIGPSAPCEY